MTPPGVRVDRGDASDGSAKLVGEVRDRPGECHDLIVDRADTGGYIIDRAVGFLCRRSRSGCCDALLFQPLLGERRRQLVDLRRCRGLLLGESAAQRRHRQDYRG